MNEKLFYSFQNAIDDELLEEAAAPIPSRQPKLRLMVSAVAACLCLAIGGTAYFAGRNHFIPAPVNQVADLGYEVTLPEDATDVAEKTIQVNDMEVSEISFGRNGGHYVCRSVRADSPVMLADGELTAVPLSWQNGPISYRCYAPPGETPWVEWYDADASLQWYLSGEDVDGLLESTCEIFQIAGLNLAGVPEGAEDVSAKAFVLDIFNGLESSYTVDGVRYAYRMASADCTGEEMEDISGINTDYEHSESASISWCHAIVRWNEGGEGTIIWRDVVPGIAYSLTMDRVEDASDLVSAAEAVFIPAQGDS